MRLKHSKRFVKRDKLLYITLCIIIAVYSAVIYYIPDFISDDVYIFSTIHNNVSSLTASRNSEFYLFLRPLSYLGFWIDYQLFFNNPVPMKYHNLIYFIIATVLFYKTIILMAKRYGFSGIKKIALLILLIWVFHFDSFISVFWIANRTEILSFLFYVSAIYVFFRFKNHSSIKYSMVASVLYLLSIAAKQTGTHLPLTLILLEYIFAKRKKKNIRLKNLKAYLPAIIIMTIAIFLNVVYFNDSVNLSLEQLWKKPFAIIGITLYSLNPFWGEEIYNYFLFHKIYAIIILSVAIIAVLIWSIKTNKKIKINELLPYLLLFGVTFFPRIVAAGGGRLNTMIVFWLLFYVIIFYLLTVNSRVKKIIRGALLLLFLLNLTTSYTQITNAKIKSECMKSRTKELIEIIDESNEMPNILIAQDIVLVPYQTYHRRTTLWGKDSIRITELNFGTVNDMNENYCNGKIKVTKSSGGLIIKCEERNAFIEILGRNRLKILSSEPTLSGRGGFSELRLKANFIKDGEQWIYHDGEKWRWL